MTYAVDLVPAAVHQLGQLTPTRAARVLAALDRLGIEPRPAGSLRLVDGRELYRVAVAGVLVAYAVEDDRRAVVVTGLAYR